MDELQRSALCDRGRDKIFDPALRESIVALIEDVRINGDDAVARALKNFDGCNVDPSGLVATPAEFDAARRQVGDELIHAVRSAIVNLRRFNEAIVEKSDWMVEIQPGLFAGERFSAIESAGLFVPSGKASYPSVAAQLGTPAVVAGVETIVMVVPPVPGSDGVIDPAVLVVASELGISTVVRANGPSGVAAMGFGTASVPKVRKIVGPGSPAVACAQIEMQRYGTVTTMLLGPSESLIIADDSARVDLLAADLLNEAEHGPDSTSVLVTPSRSLYEALIEEIGKQLSRLPEPRRSYAASSLGVNGGCVLVDSLDQAAVVADRFAPEHMQVAVKDETAMLQRLHHAGEILLGQWTPISAANFTIGCPASLPTSGFAQVSSGITADSFRKRTAVARANEEALRAMRPAIVSLCDHEGFPAHKQAVEARFE